MSTNKKILLLIVSMIGIVSLFSIVIFTVTFKDFSIKTATSQAVSIAESVRDGLTAHMVNGTMDKRKLFLENIAKHQHVKNLHLVRAPSVIKQYGEGFEEESKASEMEKEVIKSATINTKLVETLKDVYLKVSIPYVASSTENPNCMMCHSAGEGEVLGVISMDVDISTTRFDGIGTIFLILLMVCIFTIIAILLGTKYIKPYVKLFDDLEKGILKAYQGDFSYHINTVLTNEAGNVANRLNELSEVYKFKKTIELDENKNIIYNRIVYVLNAKFDINKFILFEINNKTKQREVIHNSTDVNNDELEENANTCRSFRTSTTVYSSDFKNICENCKQKTQDFICLTYTIDEMYSLVLHLQASSKEELLNIKEHEQAINNYFEMAKPVIESKILMAILKETTLRDPMTKLYNRRFLNELLDSQVSSRVKDGFVHAILMVDIDFFKQVNDTYGHDVGDEVIKRLAHIMKDNVRHSDMPVRYGGEEFLILLTNTLPEKAVEISNTINQKFAKEIFQSGAESFTKTLSIGIAYYPANGDTLWKTIKFADEALYEAKNTGRNKIVQFNPTMHKDGDNY
jgi:diguanylate cyclase (GGDEF)-like protein